MTQEAVVTSVFENGTAEVCVTRQTACGGNCSGCETCLLSSEIKVNVLNPIGADRGQRVLIESSSNKVFKALSLVYIMPVVFMLVCFFIGFVLGFPEYLCIIVSFSGLVLSALVLFIVSRKRSPVSGITYTVCKILEGT